MARRHKAHLVDGEWMTIPEAAAMLGLNDQQIYHQMYHRRCSLRTVVHLYRDGLILRQGRSDKYMVDGKWMTCRDAAQMLGISPQAIHTYRHRNKDADGNRPPLAEVVDAYRSGRAGGHHGHIPTQHRVGHKTMTMHEAADMLGVSYNTIQCYRYRHKCSLAAVVKYYEAKKIRKAEKEILKILGY